ncbi:MAG: FAD-dependent oxidoreductase [Candidatus Aenigmarchaeota archaeon]|nr:FAD-dependent oxidoreductase [Candidatus Aenigmarchaeota archaeon]
MLDRYDLIVVGGGPAGIVAAKTAKSFHPEKNVLVIKKENVGMIPCGIPYVFGTLKDVDKDTIPNKVLESSSIDLLVDEVIRIDRSSKKLITKSGKEFSYDKLILATGSLPRKIPIPGSDKENVFYVYKNRELIGDMLERIENAKKVAVIGGGFIGLEITDELVKSNKEIYLIEVLPHVLQVYFDEEFCEAIENKLVERGVRLYTNTKVLEIKGNDSVESVVLSNNEEIDVDAVIIATGTKPNIDLAKDSGLEIDKFGIKVDDRMRTSDENIFAVGDCAGKYDFLTGKPTPILLASVACLEARVAAMNVFGSSSKYSMGGVIGTFLTAFDDISLCASGYTESRARNEGIDVITGFAKVADRHPSSLPNTKEIMLKLIFERETHRLIGAELIGDFRDANLINVISSLIEKKVSMKEIITMQFGTHPLLTSPPTTFPIISAALDAMKKLKTE